MRPFQNDKTLVILKQEAATNGATLTSDQVDCKGYKYAELLLHATTSNDATNNPSTLKLQESDTTAATDFADITAFKGDDSSGFTIPNSPTATTTDPFVRMFVNLKKRKRYLRLLVTPVTTMTFSVIARLGQAEESPDSDTERGVAISVTG